MNIKKTYLLALTLLGFAFFSCNDEKEVSDFTDYTDALCTKFVLTDNSKVADALSSVYFTIDQYGVMEGDKMVAQIYNADSLPAGTVVGKLIAEMTFNNPKKVVLYTSEKDSMDYSSTDSINFANPVLMKVTAFNGVTVKYYRIKVNVHKQIGGEINWEEYAVSPLQDAGTVVTQKAVELNGTVYWFIVNENNENLLYTASSDNLKVWKKSSFVTGKNETLNIKSLKTFDNALYMASENGDLFKSVNGLTWIQTAKGMEFVNLIGSFTYPSSVKQFIALVNYNGAIHYSYSNDGMNWSVDDEIPSNFPISGFSDGVEYEGGSASTVNGFVIVGGRMQNGNLTNGTWAYDGKTWANFKSGPFLGLEGATLIPYENDPRYCNTFWLLIGGKQIWVIQTIYIYPLTRAFHGVWCQILWLYHLHIAQEDSVRYMLTLTSSSTL
jgi:hypothetical protein